MKKKIFLGVISIMIIVIFVGCTTGSGTAILMNENNSSNRMSASYSKFSGYKKTSITLKDGDEKSVNVNIVTEKGDISLKITNEDGESFYQGDKMDTSSFTVDLDKEGEYTIRIDAKKHSGSYDINW